MHFPCVKSSCNLQAGLRLQQGVFAGLSIPRLGRGHGFGAGKGILEGLAVLTWKNGDMDMSCKLPCEYYFPPTPKQNTVIQSSPVIRPSGLLPNYHH